MPRAVAPKKTDRPQTGPCLSRVQSLHPRTAQTPRDLQRERVGLGQGCGNMAGLPEEVGCRSNGEVAGRRNWGSMSGRVVGGGSSEQPGQSVRAMGMKQEPEKGLTPSIWPPFSHL